MYGLDALFLGPAQIRKLNVCWNSIYRRIFNFHRLESVKLLQLMCERLDLTHILDKSKLKFYNRLHRCDSDVLQYCLLVSKSCKNVTNLFYKYDACVGDAVCTDVIFCKFADLYRSSYVCYSCVCLLTICLFIIVSMNSYFSLSLFLSYFV